MSPTEMVVPVVETPAHGTRDRDVWMQGAHAEAAYETARRKQPAGQVYACVQTLTEQGHSADYVAGWVPYVFTADWSWRRRLVLAWRLVRPSRPRRTLRLYVACRDWWVGYYRGDGHHYVCLLPTIVLRWKRRRKETP